jgi:hypothetical protein
MYFSMQYLSLSDATVLTFLAPILTGFSGAIFLKEPFYLKQMFSGGKHALIYSEIVINNTLVCSFFGVVLIARPQFLFGSPKGDSSEMVMPEQRMLSVM